MWALSSMRVLDLTDEQGFLCGRILGDLGADVIKVEPPGGDPARNVGPFYQGEPDPEKSLYWFAYNANKRGITLNLETKTGQELFRRLARTADVVIETFRPGYLDELGLGYASLSSVHPGIILTSITPFGQTGPYRDYKGSDLIAIALSGAMSLAGEPDGEPVRISLAQTPMWTGAEAAMGTLVAYLERLRSGRGQHVDVSAQVAMLSAISHAPAFWDFNREVPTREGIFMTGRSVKGARMRVFWPCKDGYLNFIIYGGVAGRKTNKELVAWMRERGFRAPALEQKDWDAFDITQVTQEEIDELERPIGEFFQTITKVEFMEECARRGMLGYPVSTSEEILGDPQLEARGFWQEVEHPELGRRLRYPGAFAHFSTLEAGIRFRAPRIGEHNREVYTELGLSPQEIAQLKEAGIL